MHACMYVCVHSRAHTHFAFFFCLCVQFYEKIFDKKGDISDFICKALQGQNIPFFRVSGRPNSQCVKKLNKKY